MVSMIVRNIEFFERFAPFRKPFRFGAATIHGAPQVFVRVEIESGGLGRAVGASAELMVPKWFDKNPALSADENIAQLRRSLEIARTLYLDVKPPLSAFGLHAECIADQMRLCANEDIPALAAAFGPAEIDKAIIDAVLRLTGMDFHEGLSRNIVGLDNRLTADLDSETIVRFLESRTRRDRIAVRQTIGLTDVIEGPGSTREIAQKTGCQFFKVKVGGNPAQDSARLAEISSVFAMGATSFTLDANESYADLAALSALLNALDTEPSLKPFAAKLLYVEQPFPRETTRTTSLGDLAKDRTYIIDEADDCYDAFLAARTLGYRGISSKSCKGIYKALLNGARCAQWNGEQGTRFFIAAEDLTCQAGLALQQDTALANFLGVSHVERNGHLYSDGFGAASGIDGQNFLTAHPDLYAQEDGCIRVSIRDGFLATGSLACTGFASGAYPDWSHLTAMPSTTKIMEHSSWQ